jgi:thiol-disulfide isomerase/thioredoxin
MHSTLTALLATTLALPVAAQNDRQQQDRPNAERAAKPMKEGLEAPKVFEVGKPVDATITLTDVDGKEHKLGDYQGRIVVVDFWSIQCPVSRAYEERLNALHAKYGKEGIVFLAIDSNHTEIDKDADMKNEDAYARIREYRDEAKVKMPILVDRGNVVADRFNAQTTPHAFVIDKEGMLRYAGAIDSDQSGRKDDATPYLANALDALMAGKEIEMASTKPVGCSIKRAEKGEHGEGRMRARRAGRMKKEGAGTNG